MEDHPMMLYVLRNPEYDASNFGISSKHNRVWVRLPHEVDDKAPEGVPVVKLERHVPGLVRLVPESDGKRWFMFGGNFAHTSDSRFREAVEALTGHPFYGAVALHDRTEG
jgi:hypothetical protein